MKNMNGLNKVYIPSAQTVVHGCLSQRTNEEKANTLTLDDIINIDWETLTLPTAKAGGFLLQPSLPTIDRSYTMSTSVGITPSFRVPHGTYV